MNTALARFLICGGLGFAVAAWPSSSRGLRITGVDGEGGLWTVSIMSDRDSRLDVLRIVPSCDCVRVLGDAGFSWGPRELRRVRLELVDGRSLAQDLALIVVHDAGAFRLPLTLS